MKAQEFKTLIEQQKATPNSLTNPFKYQYHTKKINNPIDEKEINVKKNTII